MYTEFFYSVKDYILVFATTDNWKKETKKKKHLFFPTQTVKSPTSTFP